MDSLIHTLSLMQKRVTEGSYRKESKHILSHDLSPENCVLFHLFPLPGTDKEQRIYEK